MKINSFSPILSVVVFTFLFFACGQEKKAKSQSAPAPTPPKAQVVLKTQTTPFVLEEKAEIKSAYAKQDKLTVPDDLAPQNKWVMFEGPVLENELIAYRFYLDSRHRSDIYGKKTNDLVMDTVGWDYHDIMDWGSDILKVGSSLGIGAPAILYQDSLYTLSDYREKTIEVVKGSGQMASVRYQFKDLTIGEEQRDITQIWSIETGRPHAKVQLIVEGGELPKGARFATGIVKHLPTAEHGNTANTFYLFNWGKQSYHEQNMGMGIIANKDYSPIIVDHPLSHILAFDNAAQKVEYEFAAAWENDVMAIKDEAEFKALLLK